MNTCRSKGPALPLAEVCSATLRACLAGAPGPKAEGSSTQTHFRQPAPQIPPPASPSHAAVTLSGRVTWHRAPVSP
ncbi:unnamed protein product [Boreogadus saida]